MKIALITDGISPYVIGGMQQHSAYLGMNLVNAGHSVDLFHFVYINQKIPSSSEVNNFFFKNEKGYKSVHCCYFPNSINFPGNYLWNSFIYSKWVNNIICEDLDKYDFIYSKGFTSWALLNNVRKKKKDVKIGVNFHGYEMFQYAPNFKTKFQHLIFRPFVRIINKRADFVFSYGLVISDIICNIGVERNRILEIPSAIDSKWVREKDLSLNQPLKFLFVGRFERRKGIQEINNTILQLSKKFSSLEFHFIGSIPKEKKISSEKFKIIYHGLISKEETKQQLYDNCDVLLCPSYSEGMPNVILEAMSRGLAVIATDVGAVRLLVSNENGILIRNCNDKLIQEAIIKINSMNTDLILKMKYSSISKIKKSFLWDDVIKKMVNDIQKNI
ncbi:MAG: glycosyl transferase family 1 [Crocinitomicaceae bacterium]|nr:glycosyl transferase family 1 [Crocinitomicaceae bacterium]